MSRVNISTRYTKEAVLAMLFTGSLIGINYVLESSDLQTHCNPGIAFGIILPQAVFFVLWGGVMALIAVILLLSTREDGPLKRIGLWLIICGGIANMADRAIHGCVIDYISIVAWNSFNLADTAIFFGAVFVVFFSTRRDEKVDTEEIGEHN